MECVLRPLMEVCYPEGRKFHEKTVMVHFNNAPIHNTEEVQEHLTNLEFKRMKHQPYSPDLASGDFYLFGTMKNNFSRQRLESADKLCLAVEAFLRGLSADFLRKILVWNGNGDDGSAVNDEENMLMKQDKTVCLFFPYLVKVTRIWINIEHSVG
jgi:hypothetical protein